MEHIIDYHLNKKLKNNYIFIFIIITMILILILLGNVFKYKNYSISSGLVTIEDEEYYLKVYIQKEYLNQFLNNKILEINGSLEFFDIVSINPQLLIISNSNYYEIIVTTTLEKTDQIQNNIVSVKFSYGEEKIINKIKQIIGG